MEQQPDIEVDIVPGGLMAGAAAKPYLEMSEYIKGAQLKLKEITGRMPSEAFHAMIAAPDGPMASSEPPSHAVLQMKALAPDRAVEFAHLLQNAHFDGGKDLNDPATYNDLCTEHGLPMLDTAAITKASMADSMVADSFARCRKLGPSGYPTIFVVDQNNTLVGTIPSTYDPTAFLDQFLKIQAQHT